MTLAIMNGLLTSIALETGILVRQMDFRTAFRTAIGMSFISMIAMEAMMNAIDWTLTGGGVRHPAALQLLPTEGVGAGMSLKQVALLAVLAAAVGGLVALWSFSRAGHVTDADVPWLELLLLLHLAGAAVWIGVLSPLRTLAGNPENHSIAAGAVGCLLTAAAANKVRFVPAMRTGNRQGAVALRRSIAVERAAICLVLLATAAVTTLQGAPSANSS